MGCLLVLALFGLPRVALVWIWLTNHGYVQDEAFGGNMLFSALGFLFLPTTTLAYAYAAHTMVSADGGLSTTGWIAVLFGFFLDVVVHGGGGWSMRRRRRS
jgi:hypothetical protein